MPVCGPVPGKVNVSGTAVVDPLGSVSVQWKATVTGPPLTLIVASNAGPWPAEVAAAEQGPVYTPRTVRTDAETTGVTGGDAGLVLEGGETGVELDGETVGCTGSGGGAPGGWSRVLSTLLGVTEASNEIRPSLTTSVSGTAAVVRMT